MSKPFDLERDGVDFWLGKTRKEIANRLREKDDDDDGMHHKGMYADLVEGKIALSKGRPSKTGTAAPTPMMLAASEYRRRASELRAEGKLRGKADALLEQVAREHGIGYDHLKNFVRRSQQKTHK